MEESTAKIRDNVYYFLIGESQNINLWCGKASSLTLIGSSIYCHIYKTAGATTTSLY